MSSMKLLTHSKLTYFIVQDNWFHQPASVLRWFAAMVSHMSPTHTQLFLTHMLTPVYRFLDDDTIRDPHIGE